MNTDTSQEAVLPSAQRECQPEHVSVRPVVSDGWGLSGS